MKILALDLGGSAGYAHNLGGGLEAGTWELATKSEITAWGKNRLRRKRDPRIQRFSKLLSELSRPDIVIFEDVMFASSRDQAHLWASYRATVWLAFPADVFIECVPVQTLKKFATGSGGADKDAMARALYREHPELKKLGLNDDGVDAAWLFFWAVKNLGRMKI